MKIVIATLASLLMGGPLWACLSEGLQLNDDTILTPDRILSPKANGESFDLVAFHEKYQTCLKEQMFSGNFGEVISGRKCTNRLRVSDSNNVDTHRITIDIDERNLATYNVMNLQTLESIIYQGLVGARGGCGLEKLESGNTQRAEKAPTVQTPRTEELPDLRASKLFWEATLLPVCRRDRVGGSRKVSIESDQKTIEIVNREEAMIFPVDKLILDEELKTETIVSTMGEGEVFEIQAHRAENGSIVLTARLNGKLDFEMAQAYCN